MEGGGIQVFRNAFYQEIWHAFVMQIKLDYRPL